MLLFQIAEGITAGTEALKVADDTRSFVLFVAVVVIAVISLSIAYVLSTRSRTKSELAQEKTHQGENEVLLEMAKQTGEITRTFSRITDAIERIGDLIASNQEDNDKRFDDFGLRIIRIEKKIDKIAPNYQDTQEVDKL